MGIQRKFPTSRGTKTNSGSFAPFLKTISCKFGKWPKISTMMKNPKRPHLSLKLPSLNYFFFPPRLNVFPVLIKTKNVLFNKRFCALKYSRPFSFGFCSLCCRSESKMTDFCYCSSYDLLMQFDKIFYFVKYALFSLLVF